MPINETKINWTDGTWNPWSGCKLVSAECQHCYARELAERRRGTPAFPNGFDLTYRPHKLSEPAKLARKLGHGALIFTNSMTDLFLRDVPDAKIHEVLDAMERTPEHRYQVLTKRAHRAEMFFRKRKPPASLWMGVTIGASKSLWRLEALRQIDASTRFVSAEPLLDPLGSPSAGMPMDLDGIHWLIIGGESGSHLSDHAVAEARSLARPPKPREHGWQPREDRVDWVRTLVELARARGCAPWFKQWGGPRPESAGRLLDGEIVGEFPSHEGAMPDKLPRVHLPLLGGA